MNIIKTSALFLLSTLVLTACGGGGGGSSAPTGPVYNGTTTPAAIDVDNVETIGTSSGEATASAISQDAADDANPFAISISHQSTINGDNLISEVAKSLYNIFNNAPILPAGITISYTDLGDPNYCGGSVSAPDSLGNNGLLNGTITLSSLCYDDPLDNLGAVTLNGSMTFSQSATQLTIRSNITVSEGGNSETVNMTVSCSVDVNGFPTSCSISSDFVGEDGKIYRIADFTVIDNFNGTYDFTATFYHPVHGYVSVSADNISFGCPGGRPDAGTINLTGASGSSGTITFRGDCTGYDGTYNDGVSAGVFSGNWL